MQSEIPASTAFQTKKPSIGTTSINLDYMSTDKPPVKSTQKIVTDKHRKYLKFASHFDSSQQDGSYLNINRNKTVKTAAFGTRKSRRSLVLGSYQFNNE